MSPKILPGEIQRPTKRVAYESKAVRHTVGRLVINISKGQSEAFGRQRGAQAAGRLTAVCEKVSVGGPHDRRGWLEAKGGGMLENGEELF